LEERFQLKTHRETRTTPGFALVVAKGGPKFQPGDPAAPASLNSFAGRPLTGQNATMALLAGVLAGRLNKPVAGETGLSGGYNFTLKWTPGDDETGFGANLPGGVQIPPEIRAQIAAATSGNDPNGPSLYTAVQGQLGLRLNPKPLPIDVLVIDG